MAQERSTEELLRASGVPFTILRNDWYFENHTARLGEYLAQGAIVGATGDGRIAAAARADYAAAAAVVLTEDGHDGAIYELAGTSFTLKELAAVITDVTGTEVAFHDVTAEELKGILTGVGLDEGTASFVVSLDEATARGELDIVSDDLVRLIGRPASTLADAVRAQL